MNAFEKVKLNYKTMKLRRKVCNLLRPEDAVQALNVIKLSFDNLPDCKKAGLLDDCLEVMKYAETRKRTDAT